MRCAHTIAFEGQYMSPQPARLEPVCRLTLLSTAESEFIGPTATGFRLHGFLASGQVSGPRIAGKVRSGGGDWATARTDNVIDIDARLTIETVDGGLIYVAYTGVIDLPGRGLEDLQSGKLASVSPKIAVRMTAGPGPYSWVNRKQFVGIGEAVLSPPTKVEYDIYEI